jgi:putative CRISPR-associated protein (TIGR02619 family)
MDTIVGNFILTSCGLSILTNLQKELNFSENIYNYSNYSEKEFSRETKEKFDKFIENVKEKLLEFDVPKLKKISAELNALINFYQNDIKNFPKSDSYYFLHTDTYLGEKVAEILINLFKNKGIENVNPITAKDLKTSSFEEFQIALSDLVRNLIDEIKTYKSKKYKIIFNLTGGFKSINSFLQTVASLHADESIYIFETSENLLRIPRLPIKIEESIFKENLNLFRMLDLGIYKDNLKKEIDKLPEIVYLKIDNDFSLSPWGELIWQNIKEEVYKEKLVEPISKRIEISTQLKKQFESLNPSERLQLNKKIDDFEICIETNFKNCNKSLGFHELNGKISKTYQYEISPFDGNDSRRLYIKYKDGKYILDKIDAHLK